MPIAVFDFEIANSNYNSACSVGIVVIDNLQITKEEYFTIRPPGLVVDEEMSKIHGLTKRDLIGAFPFDVIWLKINKYFNGDYILAAHNAYFDVNVLTNSLMHINEPVPDFLYFDSIQYTKPLCDGVGASLADRLKYFNITLENSHHALEDARATAKMILKATELAQIKSIDQFLLRYQIPVKQSLDLKMTTEFIKGKAKKSFPSLKISDLTAQTDSFDETHPLYKKNIVLTGNLTNFTREEAAQAILNVGGVLKSAVSGVTNYLVVGKQDSSLVGPTGVSSKETKAAELIRKGKPIKIINEDDFLLLLKNDDN